MSSIEHCKQCGNDYDVPSEEVASYFCPKCTKRKNLPKVLDSVSLKSLTTIRRSVEDRRATRHSNFKGAQHGEESE